VKVLEDTQESDMVRHEAAEALGGIATPEVFPHLKEWMQREDAPRVVRESCQVALDMYEVNLLFHIQTNLGTHLRYMCSMKTLENSSMRTALSLPRRWRSQRDQIPKTYPCDPLGVSSLDSSSCCSLRHLYSLSRLYLLSMLLHYIGYPSNLLGIVSIGHTEFKNLESLIRCQAVPDFFQIGMGGLFDVRTHIERRRFENQSRWSWPSVGIV
jgi:hypothetical protein